MRVVILLLSILPILSFGQTNRFIYEYHYMPDSSKKDSIKKELMALDIDEKGSLFQSLDKMKSDSIMRAEFEKNMGQGGRNFNFSNRNSMFENIEYKVSKTYPDYNVYLHERLGRDRYKVEEKNKMVWKIASEVQQIGEYKAQKATTEFGGRTWTAWFSSDIAFQDGPYKFHGLPGLIVKVEDATNSHVMTLVANQSLKVTSEVTNVPQNRRNRGGMGPFGGEELTISKKQFIKAYKDYVNDPTQSMRQMISGNDPNRRVRMQMRTPDGRDINMNEMTKMIEKSVKENHIKNNNRIELGVYSDK